jgi:hypothetical protein
LRSPEVAPPFVPAGRGVHEFTAKASERFLGR